MEPHDTQFERAVEAAKLEAMAEFAAGAGHEINNPLTVISGRAQLLLRDESDPERRHALALISAQAMRVHEMIADMMLFARPPRPERQEADLLELVDRIILEFQPLAAQQDITIVRMSGNEPFQLFADPIQMAVATRAIVQNAIDAIGRSGRIEINLVQNDHEARIQVSDTGPGLSPDERRHAFDPFYSARPAGRGLGFGLSKAWRIVTNHGGRIDVESPPCGGAVFLICLPHSPR
jgi:signal transduction histidine kinase